MSGKLVTTGSRTWNIITAVWALLTIAPWAIYLAGLAKITDEVLGFDNIGQAGKQEIYMLEWFTICFEFVIVIIAIIAALSGGLRRTQSFIVSFLATNSAIIIIRVTVRIVQLNQLEDGFDPSTIGLTGLSHPLSYVRAEVAGMVSLVFANFILCILASIAGTALVVEAPHSVPPMAA